MAAFAKRDMCSRPQKAHHLTALNANTLMSLLETITVADLRLAAPAAAAQPCPPARSDV